MESALRYDTKVKGGRKQSLPALPLVKITHHSTPGDILQSISSVPMPERLLAAFPEIL